MFDRMLTSSRVKQCGRAGFEVDSTPLRYAILSPDDSLKTPFLPAIWY